MLKRLLDRLGPVFSTVSAGVALLLLAACASPPRDSAALRQFDPAAASDYLAQTSWLLTEWKHPMGAKRPLAGTGFSSRAPTMTLEQGANSRQLYGYGGCNQYNAGYNVGNGLLIVPLAPVSTEMACAPQANQLEREFLDALMQIAATSIDDYNNPRILTLTLLSGDTLVFARQAYPVAPAAFK